MTARMRRLASDWEQVKKDFEGHKYITVTPVGPEPAEKYHVTYFVNGLYLKADKTPQILNRHEVEITLHADYPRYKPLCSIQTPIWHPNFRDGQICIGDIWGAGESLSDIIINIGDMIQYKSWNSFSPLCAEAAQWAIENKTMFPVGDISLYKAEDEEVAQTVTIDLEGEEGETEELSAEEIEQAVENDFEITAEELEGVTYVPSAQRMQTLNTVKGGKITWKTILVKGLLFALLGSILGFLLGEVLPETNQMGSKILGYDSLNQYFICSNEASEVSEEIMDRFEAYCNANGLSSEDENAFYQWMMEGCGEEEMALMERYDALSTQADEFLYDSYLYEFDESEEALTNGVRASVRVGTGIWFAAIALMIGLALGIGEGVFYGSGTKAVIYALIGAGIALGIGLVSGFIAQWLYADLIQDTEDAMKLAFIRGLGWSILGLGVGVAAGLIKPNGKRILFCSLGGFIGGFIGGFLFNYVCDWIPNDVVARGAAIAIMGLLIGLGVGLLEQVAKQAWLKVIRGAFEGKEYLVFDGVTSIGNNGSNTIVLFKDKLVGTHHCDIKLEGSTYVIYDCGTPMGTVVNGARISRKALRTGDTIAVGNSVLVFNAK